MRLPLAICVTAFLVYGTLGLVGHFSLRTNAFDLSVFDYAIWSTSTGGPLAYVPLFRHSLFAQHFMPTLLVLTPLGRIFDSPTYLIVVQTLFYASAGYVFFRFASRHVTRGVALALLVAFLFSRRSHGAVTSYFYIESAEPVLIFASVLAWSSGRRALFWVFAVLAMGCKEDVAVYFLTFGVTQLFDTSTRRFGLTVVAVSAVWLTAALLVAVPYWRDVYGLSGANLFVDGRYDLESGLDGPLVRLLSITSLARIVTIGSATAGLCFLAPRWAAIALPGVALNLMAVPGTVQAGVSAHYLWPVLPWIFIAAVFGAQRIPVALHRWLPLAIVAMTLMSTPLATSFARAPWKGLELGAEIRTQLAALPANSVMLAQPNLIPHLARSLDVHGLGVYEAGQPPADYVVLSRHGNLWPFSAEQVDGLIVKYQSDSAWEQTGHGPLFVFRRR